MALFPDPNDSEPHTAFTEEDRIPLPILGAMVLALMVVVLFAVSFVREGFEPLGPKYDAGKLERAD